MSSVSQSSKVVSGPVEQPPGAGQSFAALVSDYAHAPTPTTAAGRALHELSLLRIADVALTPLRWGLGLFTLTGAAILAAGGGEPGLAGAVAGMGGVTATVFAATAGIRLWKASLRAQISG